MLLEVGKKQIFADKSWGNIWSCRQKGVTLQPIYVGKARTSGYRVVLRLPMEP